MVVEVYQPEGPCAKCKITKMALDKGGVPYTVITADDEAVQKFRAGGHSSFPIVAVDGEVAWSDYRRDKILELAKLI